MWQVLSPRIGCSGDGAIGTPIFDSQLQAGALRALRSVAEIDSIVTPAVVGALLGASRSGKVPLTTSPACRKKLTLRVACLLGEDNRI